MKPEKSLLMKVKRAKDSTLLWKEEPRLLKEH
jgi:hypothetical protein